MKPETANLVITDRDHLIHSLHHPVDHEAPVIWTRGRGVSIWDLQGKEYIDGLSGLWNVNVGHGREELADAAAAQMKELAYASAYAGATNVPAIELAERLVGIAPQGLRAVFFTCGGAESNESALKTARFYWRAQGKLDKTHVIARRQGYHGVSLLAMSATSMGSYWKMFEPCVPGFRHVQTCYPYRFEGARKGETVGQAAARELEEMILSEGPDRVGAFIAEPIHGAGGVIYPTDDYWPLVRDVCTRHEVLLIADEIITGFGRTGRWFGLDHWGVQPDILTFAKGVTSGYVPFGGMMVSATVKAVMDSVEPADRWMHAYTYSGHPTCCAVALKNIEIIEREGLCERAAAMGDRLHQGLRERFQGHPNVGDIRGGKGLMAAVELVAEQGTKDNFAPDLGIAVRVRGEMMARGLATRTLPSPGPHPAHGDLILFAPPLVIKEAEIDKMVGIARDAVRDVLGA